VNGDEKIGFRVVCDFRPSCQRNEHIFAARINQFDIITVLFYQISYFQGNVQVDILLFRDFADSSRVVSAVSGINDYDKIFPP
jgi:hypothetical protein